MHTLRIAQQAFGENLYKVEIALEGGQFRQTAVSEFEFGLDPRDQEDIRWYLEDYPLWPHDPTPTIASRVEKRMAEIGRELFRKVFQANDDARDIWADIRREANSTRIEIVTGVHEAAAIPWELIRDPNTDTCLALHAAAFVHSNFQPARPYLPVENGGGPIRILLIICRPGGRNDVPFRSVASHLIKGLADADGDLFQLDVLRPATFDALAKKLRTAKDKGKPYHAVHFDGHGAFLEMDAVIEAMKQEDEEQEKATRRLLAEIGIDNAHRFDAAATVYPKGRRSGKHGYLCFENPDSPENLRFADGEDMGNLLAETGVPVLVLNTCRSAHAETPEKPDENPEASGTDVHAQIRAFGSLAQEIVDKGTAGVVAMRYSVYVATAAQFVADMYGSLIAGNPLGKAVTLGRKALADKPIREISGDTLALQDWCVPVVYEAGPIVLFPEQKAEKPIKISLYDGRATPSRGHLDPELPPAPDAGFWGRDETILTLDRAFDDNRVVLLHAYAGSGKTAAAAEFARWYALTGGVEGPVLYTSFEQYKNLARVLDKFGQVFGPKLEQVEINWLARSDDERRDIALQTMEQIPVLWIWDNVEPVAGFPAGVESAWSEEEQKDLADFLRAARKTKAKFLLVSRRNENVWLGELPARISLPAMPMHEQEQMVRGLAKKHGQNLPDLKTWRPLLRFSGGNPMTLTVLAGQALRNGLRTAKQIEDFVEKLSRSEQAFEDEDAQGRSKSLAASLKYGFENGFSEEERKVLAMLYFFQGFVDVEALLLMAEPEWDHSIPSLRGHTRKTLDPLLDRSAESGLLTALCGGCYAIHPALPWFFKGLYEFFYSQDPLPERAFVEALGELGCYYHNQYEDGNREVIAPLIWEEANLLHARRRARANEWWLPAIGAMQGLRTLYAQTGRHAEWKRLVEEISPDFVDPTTSGSLPGLEDHWCIVTNYQAWLAGEERNWVEAERLQTGCVKWERKLAASYIEIPPEKLDEMARNVVRSLAVSVHNLGEIQRKMCNAKCIEAYEESFDVLEKIGERSGAAICALGLGHAYKDIPAIRDLEKAEKWYERSLKLRKERDKQGRAKCFCSIGHVAYERFKEGGAVPKSNEELTEHLSSARCHYHAALEMIPADAVFDLAVTHNALGNVYSADRDFDQAVKHLKEAVRYFEMHEDLYHAAKVRYNMASNLVRRSRVADALDYARAALHNFEMYGYRASDEIEQTKKLIAVLEEME